MTSSIQLNVVHKIKGTTSTMIYALLPRMHGGEISGLYLRPEEPDMISATDRSIDRIAAVKWGGHVLELRPSVPFVMGTFLRQWGHSFCVGTTKNRWCPVYGLRSDRVSANTIWFSCFRTLAS